MGTQGLRIPWDPMAIYVLLYSSFGFHILSMFILKLEQEASKLLKITEPQQKHDEVYGMFPYHSYVKREDYEMCSGTVFCKGYGTCTGT